MKCFECRHPILWGEEESQTIMVEYIVVKNV